jgi:Zn-dependent oligopeptidase
MYAVQSEYSYYDLMVHTLPIAKTPEELKKQYFEITKKTTYREEKNPNDLFYCSFSHIFAG